MMLMCVLIMTVSCYELYKLCPRILDTFKIIFIILLLNRSVMQICRQHCPASYVRETLDVSPSTGRWQCPMLSTARRTYV